MLQGHQFDGFDELFSTRISLRFEFVEPGRNQSRSYPTLSKFFSAKSQVGGKRDLFEPLDFMAGIQVRTDPRRSQLLPQWNESI